MKIGILRLEFVSAHPFAASGSASEREIVGVLRADLSINYAETRLHLADVALLPFYLDLRAALYDTMMRGVLSHIRHDFEEVLTFIPHTEGCLVSQPRPPYPMDGSNFATEEMNFNAARSLVRALEAQMRERLQAHRTGLMNVFDATQSPALFELLKVIDDAAEVKSELTA